MAYAVESHKLYVVVVVVVVVVYTMKLQSFQSLISDKTLLLLLGSAAAHRLHFIALDCIALH